MTTPWALRVETPEMEAATEPRSAAPAWGTVKRLLFRFTFYWNDAADGGKLALEIPKSAPYYAETLALAPGQSPHVARRRHSAALQRHPAGAAGSAVRGRRRRFLPVQPVVELRPRPGPEHHRRTVHRHDQLAMLDTAHLLR